MDVYEEADESNLQASNENLRIVAQLEHAVAGDAYPLQRERWNRADLSITHPGQVAIEGVDATCEDGVCRIALPLDR